MSKFISFPLNGDKGCVINLDAIDYFYKTGTECVIVIRGQRHYMNDPQGILYQKVLRSLDSTDETYHEDRV